MAGFDEKIKNIKGRVPANYLGHYITTKKLKEYFKVETERELLDALGVDCYFLSARDLSQNEGILKCYQGNRGKVEETQRICPLGIRWQRGAYESKFCVDEAIKGPFSGESTLEEILSYPFPTPDDFDFSPLIEECETFGDRIVIGGLWSGIMGDCYRMYGFQDFLTDLALRPQEIQALIDRMTQMYLELNEKYFTQLEGKMDVWFFGNDFGSQNGMLFSPGMWKEFFFENIKKMCALAHSHGLKVMMHSCGSIVPIIPYLIEAGVDILDPIQITAKGMDIENLQEKFGGKIIFHGGIDTQELLPFGTAQEVKETCNKTIETLGKEGGYIFAGSQILGMDIPVENIVAMYGANEIK